MTVSSVGYSYVASFIESLELKGVSCLDLARLLFKTEECCKHFYIGFMGVNRYVIDDLFDYREHKLSKLEITIDEYIDMCYNNMHKAFEETFLQPISLIELVVIDKAIADGSTSLEVIYSEFKKNPNKNIMKNVL